MINNNNLTLNISKWLNNYIDENKIDIEEMAKKIKYSTDYLNVLLDYSKHLDKYKDENINVSVDFIMKISNTYNVKVDEILKS